MTIVEMGQLASLLSNVVSMVGLPVGIWVYFQQKEKERLDREYGTYNALDDKYVEYLTHCLNYPELDLYYVPLSTSTPLDAEQQIQQLALFEILLAQMERAYLMYYGHSDKIRARQWAGWEAYIDKWTARPIFKQLLQAVDANQFESEFSKYLAKK